MANDSLQDKMDQFMPGLPLDPADCPTLHFQLLEGKVYSLLRFPDESVARGEMTLQELEYRFDRKLTDEGWYSASGIYLGEQLPGSLLEE